MYRGKHGRSGLSFIYSAMYIGIMLVVDLLYGIIDPRIRLAKGDD